MKKEAIMQNYKKTEYPEIFKDVYWGCFTHDPKRYPESLIQNRNKFIVEHYIKKAIRVDVALFGLDHLEGYTNKSGMIILLCSNYNNEENKVAKIIGFKPYKKLYDSNTKTYIKTFKTLSSFKSYCRAVNFYI